MANIKFTWSAPEDEALIALVREKGEKKWCTIASSINDQFGGAEKTGKQCRERWHNHLNPRLNKESFTLEDEVKVFEFQRQYGNKWSLIAEHFEGRNDNFIKNCFYSAIRRNLRKYNKKKVPSKQLKGTISALMRNPETRKLLMSFPEHDSAEVKKEVREDKVKREVVKPNLKVDVRPIRVFSNIGDITPTQFAKFNLGVPDGEEFYCLTPLDFFNYDRLESLTTTPVIPEFSMQGAFQCMLGTN